MCISAAKIIIRFILFIYFKNKFTLLFKSFGVGKICFMFLKLPRVHLFDPKYSKISNIVKNYYNLK